eukprot:4632239-Pleurochrysis_carterae.AAC.1
MRASERERVNERERARECMRERARAREREQRAYVLLYVFVSSCAFVCSCVLNAVAFAWRAVERRRLQQPHEERPRLAVGEHGHVGELLHLVLAHSVRDALAARVATQQHAVEPRRQLAKLELDHALQRHLLDRVAHLLRGGGGTSGGGGGGSGGGGKEWRLWL